MAVFARALEIYVEREAEHGSTWKQFGAGDAAHHVVHKAARMKSAAPLAERGTPVALRALDSAVDACNYAGFYVRHIEGAK